MLPMNFATGCWTKKRAKSGGAEIGPTKRGKGMKIMAIVDRHGLPLSVSTHAANHHEVLSRGDPEMEQRDWELLDEQVRGHRPPRNDGLIVLTVAAAFFAGMILGGLLVPHESELMRIASNDGRAGEIAHLTWAMVTDPTGAIGTVLELPDYAAKKGSGRVIPLHEDLQAALATWRAVVHSDGPVIVSGRGGPMTPQSIVVWFANAYRVVGLNGCSSHSGRRAFITRAARLVHKAGGSLRDVQLLAGHRSIQTTQRYIEGDSDAQRKLVSLI
jgi:hypothetical protein